MSLTAVKLCLILAIIFSVIFFCYPIFLLFQMPVFLQTPRVLILANLTFTPISQGIARSYPFVLRKERKAEEWKLLT